NSDSAVPSGYAVGGGDCNDSNISINPGMTELADDGIDNDCNGLYGFTWYLDSDGDGFGNPLIAVISESDLSNLGYVQDNRDLVDSNNLVNPAMEEIPNDGLDNDCNGLESVSWYQDSDSDGFGNVNSLLASEIQPAGYVNNSFDCNDGESSINPMAVDIGDGIDNNCNGDMDELPIIPDTGQLASYTNTYGEDSDYLINPPSYVKLDENGNELQVTATSWRMVKDQVTSLIWVLKDSSDGVKNSTNIHDADNTYTVEEASDKVISELNNSNFGNSSEWRLPSIKELAYLANSSNTNPSITTTYFPLVKTSDKIWSGTPVASDTTKAWFYSLSSIAPLTGAKTESLQVWAVRGVEKTSEFKGYVSGIIIDNKTGLMWQKESASGNGKTFNDALTYCENLSLGGYSDWRLPNKNELTSLLSFDRPSPTIDPMFTNTNQGGYWTSTTFFNSFMNFAWSVDFFTTSIVYNSKSELKWVRAVRGGHKPMAKTWYKDRDGDGYGDDAVRMIIDAMDMQPVGYVANNADCNDDPNALPIKGDLINPGAADLPDDDIDQDCTGSDAFTWYKDSDNDGFGDQSIYLVKETQPATYVRNFDDCDDSNKSINPSMTELVDDGLDNNCDNLQKISFYVDGDGDGVGAGLSEVREVPDTVHPPVGYSFTDRDCNDGDSTVSPGLVEIFDDLLDTNCNGENDDDSLQVIPDTGQVTSYTGRPGEDGDYLINEPSLTKIAANGDLLDVGATEWFAVRDNITGFYWEVKTVDNQGDVYAYDEAVDYAESLNLAGFEDWRVPTLTELATIAHLDLKNPAIDKAYFPRMASDSYWTITKLGSGEKAYTVSFRFGESYNENKTGHFRVISVRGGQNLTSRLISNADGTLADTETGLIWNNIDSTNSTWNYAISRLDIMNSLSEEDWRLPTENDMNTLLDILEQDSTFDFSSVFTGVPLTGSFWTTVLAETDPGKALVFSLITGQTNEVSIQQTLRSIAVRGVIQIRFIVNGDGTVFDSKTGLMWMRQNANNGLFMTFENALAFSNTLEFATYNDWRVPSRNEMLSLLDASIDDSVGYATVFPDSEAVYWTSTTCPGLTDSHYGWQIDFNSGAEAITIGDYTNSNVFRAVRGGNPE
ncbi:MAG: DUF1566 domain-containing protein, partial [Desulfobacteraceae bacterium]